MYNFSYNDDQNIYIILIIKEFLKLESNKIHANFY